MTKRYKELPATDPADGQAPPRRKPLILGELPGEQLLLDFDTPFETLLRKLVVGCGLLALAILHHDGYLKHWHGIPEQHGSWISAAVILLGVLFLVWAFADYHFRLDRTRRRLYMVRRWLFLRLESRLADCSELCCVSVQGKLHCTIWGWYWSYHGVLLFRSGRRVRLGNPVTVRTDLLPLLQQAAEALGIPFHDPGERTLLPKTGPLAGPEALQPISAADARRRYLIRAAFVAIIIASVVVVVVLRLNGLAVRNPAGAVSPF